MKKIILSILLLLYTTTIQAGLYDEELISPEGTRFIIKTYEIIYPVDVNTPRKKIAYLYRLKERLRLRHNTESQRLEDGLITTDEWFIWKRQYFRARSEAIAEEISANRQLMRRSTDYNVRLDNDFIEK